MGKKQQAQGWGREQGTYGRGWGQRTQYGNGSEHRDGDGGNAQNILHHVENVDRGMRVEVEPLLAPVNQHRGGLHAGAGGG